MTIEHVVFERKFENSLQGGVTVANEVFEHRGTKLSDKILDAVILQNTFVGAMGVLARLNERRPHKV